MNKIDFVIKLYYPVNGVFNKLLPKTRLFIAIHKYLLYLIDSKFCKLINDKALKEIELLLKTKHKRITLVWDCFTSPVTYGDFIDFCMFARYVKSINYEIVFYIAADKFRNDWHKIYSSENKKERFLNELKEVGEFILEGNCIRICNFSDIDLDSTKSYIPFLREIVSRSDFQVFKYAEVMTETIHTRNPSKDFLMKCSHSENLIDEGDYIAWHIRGSSINSSEEDELPEDIIAYYEIISFLTKLPIVVVSSRGALPFLRDVLGHKDNIIFSKDRFDDFVSDAKIIIGSKIYIQCGWGGTFTLAVGSDLPYLGPPIEKVLAPWQKLKIHVKNDSKIRPWARKNQLTYDGIEDFREKLSNILKKIS